MIKTEREIISDYNDWIDSVPANSNEHYEELVDERHNRIWVGRHNVKGLIDDMGMYLKQYEDEKVDRDAIIHNLKIIYEDLTKELKGVDE